MSAGEEAALALDRRLEALQAAYNELYRLADEVAHVGPSMMARRGALDDLRGFLRRPEPMALYIGTVQAPAPVHDPRVRSVEA